MRLVEISDNRNDILDAVYSDCKPYLNSINNKESQYKLYRGSWSIPTVTQRKAVRPDRMPKDSAVPYHELFLDAFSKAGFKANRDNSIFCTGNRNSASDYGSTFVVYPIGNFDFTWSPRVLDLTNIVPEMTDDVHIKQVIKPLPFSPEMIELFNLHSYFPHAFYRDPLADGSMKDFIGMPLGDVLGHFNPSTTYFRLPEEIYTLENIEFTDWVKDKYQNDDMMEAIESGKEIMVSCKEIYLVPSKIDAEVFGVEQR